MDQRLFELFKNLVATRTGLNLRDLDSGTFQAKIIPVIRSLKLPGPLEYYSLLEKDTSGTDLEWQKLIPILVTGESYFFRDKGQFSLLETSILPELMERRKKGRTLRIWSAGCSTGEEAYSLAMMVDRLIPNLTDWNILISGTDINLLAIEKAKRGRYGKWALRQTPPDMLARYFLERDNEWELVERICKMVNFHTINIVKEGAPGNSWDLILCRNLFIYFTPDSVSKVVSRIIESMAEDGYLLTGHAEINLAGFPGLQARAFPESIIYQRKIDTAYKAPKKAMESMKSPREQVAISRPRTVTPLKKEPPEVGKAASKKPKERTLGLMEEAEVFFREGAYAKAVEKAEDVIKENPGNFQACYLTARAYANLGEHDKAEKSSTAALEIDPFSAEIHYLLAQIARDRGDIKKEKEMLQKVIYLEPSFFPGYLEMGMIYEHEGEFAKARKARANALNILKQLPGNDSLEEPYTEFTAGDLTKHLEKIAAS